MVAAEKVLEAEKSVLKADLETAEALLLKARELVPDSKNVNHKLGRFYYDNGEQEKGLAVLFEFGSALRIPRLQETPKIDGRLEDAVWETAQTLTQFYQNIFKMAAYPTNGKTEAYIGHANNTIFFGIKGYEPSTDNLEAKATQRDEDAWEDDCVELFFDVNRDYQSYHQIVINSLGTVFDLHSDGTNRQGDIGWNGEYEVATQVDADSWTLEIAIAADQFTEKKIEKGVVWSGNIARIRIANDSEYGQWAPTYGMALRPEHFGFFVFE